MRVLWPTHDPALADASADAPGAVPRLVATVRALIASGACVVLDHPLSRATLSALPDLARYVDDTLPGLAGVSVSLAPDLVDADPAALRPYWRAFAETCLARGVGFVAASDRLDPVDGAGLREPAPPESYDTTEENLRLAYLGDGRLSPGEALDAILEPIGSLARFVNPDHLGLSPEELANPVGVEPRDLDRVFRERRRPPWLLIDLGDDPPRPLILEPFLARVIALDTVPHLASSAPGDAIVALAQRLAIPLFASAERANFDYVVVCSRLRGAPFTPASQGPGRPIELWVLDSPTLDLVVAGPDPLPEDLRLLGALERAPDRPGFTVPDPAAVLPGTGDASKSLLGPGRHPTRRQRTSGRPFTVLGLACTTLQNHGAALLRDGQVVAAVQEERFTRRKQSGWHPQGRPDTTVVSDPRLPLDLAIPSQSLAFVLERGGITLDEVDLIAFNGIPARFVHSYSLTDPKRPPEIVRVGRTVFVPHHLTHAASAYRVSGFDDAFVFTVDGRGERETACFFETDAGQLRRVFDVLCHEDSLIGGVYEYFTTILGFGHYGQGSTMGLACMGPPGPDVSRFLSARTHDDHSIHDRGIIEAFGHLARERDAPLLPEHIGLAASLQAALEQTVIALLTEGLAGRPAKNLCLAGGVALNCSMNQRLRHHFGVENIFVQPGAHDAGTSLGAALEAHFDATGERCTAEMTHAYLGPDYSDAEVRATLARFGMPYSEPADLAGEVAQRIADGQIVCFFQDRLELGPRALGARSILADPRRPETKARVNVLKGRQWWRPFGPAILAGREAEWFEHPMRSPFMLFTLPVRPERRDQIPAVLHTDDSTRPQSVGPDANPLYYEVIRRFDALTGVPMVVNTSFNTAHEPIV
ncbi:MAG: carbamoyltransferase C-terminal domain-containing protein, partial [Myxococcota bacterium]